MFSQPFLLLLPQIEPFISKDVVGALPDSTILNRHVSTVTQNKDKLNTDRAFSTFYGFCRHHSFSFMLIRSGWHEGVAV